jgi:hypothetical protein
MRHALGSSRLPGAGRAVEVQDAAPLLWLEAADAPDLLQLVADLNGTEAVEDLLLHSAMEDQTAEFVARPWLDEDTHFGFVLLLGLAVAAARVAMVGGDGRVGWKFVEFLDG